MDQHSYSRTIDRQDIERLIECLIGFLDAVDAPHEDLEDEIGDAAVWRLRDKSPCRAVVSSEDLTCGRPLKPVFPQTGGEFA